MATTALISEINTLTEEIKRRAQSIRKLSKRKKELEIKLINFLEKNNQRGITYQCKLAIVKENKYYFNKKNLSIMTFGKKITSFKDMSEAVSDMSSDMLRIYMSEVFRHVRKGRGRGVTFKNYIFMSSDSIFCNNLGTNKCENNAVKTITFLVFILN